MNVVFNTQMWLREQLVYFFQNGDISFEHAALGRHEVVELGPDDVSSRRLES